MQRFDVVVLGAGSAGEVIANTLVDSGRSVAMIEQRRVGGECAYVSCMPSKAMLRSAQTRNLARNLASLGGSSQPVLLDSDSSALSSAVARRDRIVLNRSDAKASEQAISGGISLFRGHGVCTAKDRITIGDDELSWHDLIIATGSRASIPEIDGLKGIQFWTSDQALSAQNLPESVLIVGGGPVGCELSQIFIGFGVKTTIVEFSEQLAGKEHPDVAALLARNLIGQGLDLFLNTKVVKVEQTAEDKTLIHLSNGRQVIVERLILAVGRQPNSEGIGLDLLGIIPSKSGALEIDEFCRARGQERIWAAGDITGIAPYTHTANYQGRIVAGNILGGHRTANYSAIPRAIYTDPPVSSVGTVQGRGESEGLISERFDLEELSRNRTDGESGGLLILTADREKGTLVGVTAIGPHADEWMAEATLAIRAEIPLSILSDVVHAFPTFSEAFEEPIRKLAELIHPPK